MTQDAYPFQDGADPLPELVVEAVLLEGVAGGSWDLVAFSDKVFPEQRLGFFRENVRHLKCLRDVGAPGVADPGGTT